MKHMRTPFDRKTLASIYLHGNGIEVGALQFPLKLPRSAKVRYVDRLTIPDLRKHYPALESYKLAKVNILDDGETLGTIGDATLDFVVANHFLEHCENPIKAVTNFLRVLREGGFCSSPFPINVTLLTGNAKSPPFIILFETMKEDHKVHGTSILKTG